MIVDRYYYHQLNKQEQAIYKAFYDGVMAHEEIIPIPVRDKFNQESFERIFMAMTRDNPLIYFLNQSACSTASDMFGHLAICPQYFFSKEKVKEYNRKIEKVVNELAGQLRLLECSDYEKEIRIHDWICQNIAYDYGVTVSIGVSWNKIYAKLGSDYKKPDAITEFNRSNYRDKIWGLPVSNLLYVGRQTNKKLRKLGIRTIGELAETDENLLDSHFGKMGMVLWSFANGWDEDPVCKEGYEAPVKSIGNSTTTPRDLETDLDVWIIQMALAESVAARLRKHGFKCKTVEITVRDNGLSSFTRQRHLRQPTNITDEIVTEAFQLFKDSYKWEHPIRSLGIRAADLVLDDIPVQLDLFGNQEKQEKLEKLDRTVDEIRRRFGYFSIQRAVMCQDKVLSHLDAGTHTVHPHSYFHG